jgi:hypothetical protein
LKKTEPGHRSVKRQSLSPFMGPLFMKPNINSLDASHGSVMPGMPRCENRREMLRRRFQDVLTRATTQPAGLDPGGYEPNCFFTEGQTLQFRSSPSSCAASSSSSRSWRGESEAALHFTTISSPVHQGFTALLSLGVDETTHSAPSGSQFNAGSNRQARHHRHG